MEKVHCKNTYCIGNDVTWVEAIIFKQAWRLQKYYLFRAQLDVSALTLLRAYMQCNSHE